MSHHDIKTPALNLTSLVSKKTRRAKARLMQNFGKADKTTDELFEVYQLNFARQQSTALNLQKHLKHYVNCLKELHDASKGLSQCLLDMYERDWPKHDLYENNAYELDHIGEDLEEKIKESVLVPLEQYLSQFAEIREKISKRGRKLVDYDSQRHHFEALQQHQNSKHQSATSNTLTTTTSNNSTIPYDDSKLNKSREQLDEARRVYENLNNELHDELPALYDNRIPFVITVFQRLFSSNLTYNTDNAAIYKSYLASVDLLAKATEKGAFNSHPRTTSQYHHNSTTTTTDITTSSTRQVNTSSLASHSSDNLAPSVASTVEAGNINTDKRASDHNDLKKVTAPETVQFATGGSVPPASTEEKPAVYLHKVKATYKYLAEDEDELSFEAGEVIQVIEYDDPQEQEEGWLMGIRESTGQKGLFPANFTREL